MDRPGGSLLVDLMTLAPAAIAVDDVAVWC